MQRKWPHPGRQHSSQGPQRASTCLDEFHERSRKSPRGRCESESEGQMQKRKSSVIQITSFFSADGETRTLARQCLAVHVSPQSGIRLTAPRGRCESESEGQMQKRKSSVIQITSFFRADGETRTHTGQRPLPPQSSVSTISPHPQVK